MNQAGFDATPLEMDLSSRNSILHLIAEAQGYGNISMLVNAAGVSPSQASVETILQVDLYGTAVLLEEVGKVIMPGGTGVTISSQSGHRMRRSPRNRTNSWPSPLRKNCLRSPCSTRSRLRTPCMPIRWRNAATSSASWRKPLNGALGARASTPFPRAL